VDVQGPKGVDFSAVGTGHQRQIQTPGDGIEAAQREAKALVELRVPFELTREAIDNAIELWGMAAANLVSLFNPEMIVFGGGIFGPATKFLDRINAEARRWAQPIAIDQVRFVASELGSDAGLFGAGRLAMASGEEAGR